jgi:hypothetical protein
MSEQIEKGKYDTLSIDELAEKVSRHAQGHGTPIGVFWAEDAAEAEKIITSVEEAWNSEENELAAASQRFSGEERHAAMVRLKERRTNEERLEQERKARELAHEKIARLMGPGEEVQEIDDEGNKIATLVPVASLLLDGAVVEEVWDRKSRPRFVVKWADSDDFEYAIQIETGEVDEKGRRIVYVPIDDDALKLGQVIIPEAPEPCTFAEAFQEGVELALKLYDCVPAKQNELKVLVAVAQASWFLDRFGLAGVQLAGVGKFAPIVAFRGPSGSGKNRALTALRFNSYKPYFDQSTNKIPSLFRPMALWKGTLCLDECDLGKSDETAEVIHYLNCRCYGTPIARINPNNVKELQSFSNFGLTIVTQRRSWEDDATENRTLPYLCERSQKLDLATAESQDWLRAAIRLQNHLVYLRLTYWGKVEINPAARVPGVKDHRLTASILPLLALEPFAPEMVADLKGVLLKLDQRRRGTRAISKDGIVINLVWSKIKDRLVGVRDGIAYVGNSRRSYSEEEESVVLPLEINEFEAVYNLKGKETRRVLQSLQLVREEAKPPTVIRVGKNTYRPIWFHPEKLEPRLRDFVVDYQDNELAGIVEELPGLRGLDAFGAPDAPQGAELDSQLPPTSKNVTLVTDVTLVGGVVPPARDPQSVTDVTPNSQNGMNSGEYRGEPPENGTTPPTSVTSVTSVTDSAPCPFSDCPTRTIPKGLLKDHLAAVHPGKEVPPA